MGRLVGVVVAGVSGLGVLLIISPGVGTESGLVSWSDAWRARLGIESPPGSPRAVRLADLDEDGALSADERAAFTETARAIADRRIGRSLLALVVGLTLALCGGVFQVLFRNPLATPYTLGIASGGSLAALIALRLGWSGSWMGLSLLSLAALLGALLVIGVVLVVASGPRRLTANELLLAGVTIGLFCTAMMMFVTSVSDQRQTFAMTRWMMGSLDDPLTSFRGASLLPLILPSWVVLLFSARALNQYRLGDELAASRGVNVSGLRFVCVLFCSLATAAVVAYCGPIGFVGLVVPHAVGLVLGADCRIVLPAAAFAGGVFLIICDWLSQVSLPLAGHWTGRDLGGATLPIGVVTAIVGVPIFLVLLRARRSADR